jgi:hypothetical protein
MNCLARYIPHGEAERYRRAGWQVTPLLGHHARYSMLAVRPEYPECDKEEGASKTERATLALAE